MTSRARSAITDSGGWILDVKMFSNVSLCFRFEIPAVRLERLRDGLAKTGLRLSKASIDALTSLSRGPAEEIQSVDIAGSLQITFVHNEPDLRVEVPPIPG